MKIDGHITNREFKLLLQPEGFDRHDKVEQLRSVVFDICKSLEISCDHLDNAATGLRNVYFFDTPKQDLRRNHTILRVRESRRDVFVDDWCEVTLKRRIDSLKDALRFDPIPRLPRNVRLRVKQEILRGDKPSETHLLYSNNSIIDPFPVDKLFSKTFASVVAVFKNAEALKIKPNTPIGVVGGQKNKIAEACMPIGQITFGPRVHAHCDVAIWFRKESEPLICELAFAYRVTDKNRDDAKAHSRADRLFSEIQMAIPTWLAAGTTKTAVVYGKAK